MTGTDRVYQLIKLLLYVAKEEGVEVTATKLQKIFFLLEKEEGVDLGLEFTPWFFGPYSSLLQDYIDKLIEKGDVSVEEQEVKDVLSGQVVGYKRVYVLSSDFNTSQDDKSIEEFFRKWVRMSRSEILNYVYRKYPEYAKYSLIRDKILGVLNE
ncbi:conjugal transfer protein [Acidianus sp. HS-5]|uniref:conjugal transfer protein n=1 Tax=Acidianus sp. HS-5 TaxID=2886040 RepID=UPI001F3C6D1B|nr:conjugal transfer protein [Acidianus sp. HS-5]BDC18264.1 hypothetical protein HS5_11540 [Acidianus sp. HS-5]